VHSIDHDGLPVVRVDVGGPEGAPTVIFQEREEEKRRNVVVFSTTIEGMARKGYDVGVDNGFVWYGSTMHMVVVIASLYPSIPPLL